MSSRATRGPSLFNAGGGDTGVRAGVLCLLVVFGSFGTGGFVVPWALSHVRRVSSETVTPVFARPSAMARTEAPSLRAFKMTRRNLSSASVFLFFGRRASAINWESCCALSGNDWDMIGDLLVNVSEQ